MKELVKLNPIGIGTYNIDLNDKDKSLNALLYSVEKGQNFLWKK